MSLLSKLASSLGGGASSNGGRLLVIDGEKMLSGGDRTTPVDRVQLVQKLGKFAERENLEVHTVFGGRPLREAAHGDEYYGVTVYYAEGGREAQQEELRKAAKKAGRKAVVFTQDADLEQDLGNAGFTVMRAQTLQKSLELSNGDGSSGRQGGPGGGRRSRSRRGRRSGQGRQRRGNNEEAKGGQQQENSNASSSPSSAADTTVKNLIDLVE